MPVTRARAVAAPTVQSEPDSEPDDRSRSPSPPPRRVHAPEAQSRLATLGGYLNPPNCKRVAATLGVVGLALAVNYAVQLYFAPEPIPQWCVETTGEEEGSLLYSTIKAACGGSVPSHEGCPLVAKATFANIANCEKAHWLLRTIGVI
ncbi:MAG: hypothetical protein SP1CHLAM54_16130 [Chlamydiia bacterium]|nr:hypothetical protein [Chlamydiia bacterium]MCH9616502.1 hypothetical protein [Chlamydiia bacterium]MCH9629512.1 hypothetical protein [Chlamydiia bacterium]